MSFHRIDGPNFRCPPLVSKRIRDFARGQTCTLRLPGCDGGGETTVHCHIRRFGWAGVGQKPHDFLGVHGCVSCHALLDSRDPEAPCGDDDILRALGETLTRLWDAGLMKEG